MSFLEGLLLLLLAGLPWSEGGASPTALALIHTAVFLALAAVLAAGRLDLRLDWSHLAFAGFLAAGILSLAGAEYFYGSFETLWEQAIWFLLALILAASAASDRFGRVASVVVVASGSLQALQAIGSRIAGGAALSSTFVNPNHLAAYLNVAFFVSLVRAGIPSRSREAGARIRERWFWLAAGAACAGGTVAIASRGALLALVLSLLLAGRGLPGEVRLRRLRIPLLALLVLVGALSIQLRFSDTRDPYRHDRPRLWLAALEAWSGAPVLGIGPGMYEHRGARFSFPQETETFRFSKQPRSAHSQPIQVLAEEGVAGLLAAALFAGAAWTVLGRRAREPGEAGASARAVLMAGTAVGIQSLFETPFTAPAIPMTLLLLAWPATRPAGFAGGAWSFSWAWPGGAGGKEQRRLVTASVVVLALLGYGLGVAGPYLSHLAARYAESPGTPPVRIDLASRLSERLNPAQPFLGYRRACAAMARVERISPPLLANAMESLERAARLEPGDYSVRAQLGRLLARAAADLPGAGEGARAAAEGHFTEAVRLAPHDARLRLERGALRLSRGDLRGALRDAAEALELEPRALAAHQLRIEALLAAGRREQAGWALARMDRVLGGLRRYEPLNGYEAGLLRYDPERLERLRSRLGMSVLTLPAGGLLRGGRGGELHGGPLLQDLVEEGLLGAPLLGALPVAIGVGVHAGLADHRLDLVQRHRLDGVIQEEPALRTVVLDNGSQARRLVRHEHDSRENASQ